PCRRHACAKSARLTVKVPRAVAPQRMPGAPTGPGAAQPGTAGPDAFAGSPTVAGCPVFPRDNPWNTDVSHATVDKPTSDAYINSLGATTLWPDFGSGAYGDYGIPYTSVPLDQPLVPIAFTEDD